MDPEYLDGYDADMAAAGQRIADLEAKLAAAIEDKSVLARTYNQLFDEAKAMQEELAAAERDAGRYRWLRESRCAAQRAAFLDSATTYELDAAIDFEVGEMRGSKPYPAIRRVMGYEESGDEKTDTGSCGGAPADGGERVLPERGADGRHE